MQESIELKTIRFSHPELAEWLSELRHPIKLEGLGGEGTPDGSKVRFTLQTAVHEYKISATNKYLGCIASSRHPRKGETWTRGNDLADGDYSRKTWDNILHDIASYELAASNYLNEHEIG